MLAASIGHCFAFPYSEYEELKPRNITIRERVESVLLASDVFKEVKDSISPKNYDFELID